jgi:hypothetical protein
MNSIADNWYIQERHLNFKNTLIELLQRLAIVSVCNLKRLFQ